VIGAVMYVIFNRGFAKVSSCFPDSVRYAEARLYDRRDCKQDNLFAIKNKVLERQ